MPPLDFPNYPGIGDEFFGFTWDGVRWIARGTTALPWLPLTGGQMSGPISLAGNAAMPLEAVPLQQVQTLVDQESTDLQPQIDAALNNTGRNLLDNAMFNIQQRGPGPFTISTAYTADRWMISITGDATASVTTSVMQPGVGTDEELIWTLQTQVAGGSTAAAGFFLAQRIELARRVLGHTVTVSFWARAMAGAPRVGLGFGVSYGAQGSAATFGHIGITPAVTSAWQRYSATATIPSGVGQTFAGAGEFFQLELWLSDGGNQANRSGGIGVQSSTVQFWGIQLEIGTQATPLDKLDLGTDLANCQRFYQAGFYGSWGGYAPAAGSLGAGHTQTFAVKMRAIPSMATSGFSGINAGNIAPGNIATDCFSYTALGNATGGVSFTLNWTASADL